MGVAPQALVEMELVLASTSSYRAELLRRLTPRFRQIAPHTDESRRDGEAPQALAERLALAKARAVAAQAPGTLVIGSDQVAALNDTVLGKPGSIERAIEQLAACSGREVTFFTALALLDARVAPHVEYTATDLTRVRFRTLTREEIARYVEREQPLDCAGSFKVEGLGISLFEAVENRDPTALIGLPLLAVCALLRAAGVSAP
jgi:septum formation protein